MLGGKITLALASDHAGYALKRQLLDWLSAQGYAPLDCGTYSDESCDYPIYAHRLAEALQSGRAVLGIGICGTGNGISMALNRHKGIRAALCWTPELAGLARAHNDANVLTLPGRFLTVEQAIPIVEAFFSGTFQAGRHQRRIDLLDQFQ